VSLASPYASCGARVFAALIRFANDADQRSPNYPAMTAILRAPDGRVDVQRSSRITKVDVAVGETGPVAPCRTTAWQEPPRTGHSLPKTLLRQSAVQDETERPAGDPATQLRTRTSPDLIWAPEQGEAVRSRQLGLGPRKLNKGFARRPATRDWADPPRTEPLVWCSRGVHAGVLNELARSGVTDGWTAPVSPGPVRALWGHAERDAWRLREHIANLVHEHLVGVGHPLPLMHKLEPGVDRECLYEAPNIGDVFVNTPRIGPVAPSRVTQFVDCAQELRTVRGLDAVLHHREHRPLVILNLSHHCRRAPVRRRGSPAMAESFPQTALPTVVAPKMKLKNTASPRPRAQSGKKSIPTPV
jgi:hypothetical protein